MISVRLVGHIKTAVGRETLDVDRDEIEAGELLDAVRGMAQRPDAGFDKYNTLVMVEDGEAFVPAATRRVLRGGDRVVLIPFSHGG